MTRAGNPLLWSALLFAGAIAVALLVAQRLEERQRTEAEGRLATSAQGITTQLVERLGSYERGLRGMRGAVISLWPDRLTRAKVLNYVRSRDHGREFPGARGFGFIRRVPRGEEDAFVVQAQRDGQPGFGIKELAPHDQQRLVIQYIEPEAVNQAAIGLDIASEANRHEAVLMAMRTGEAALTHPITLVQASGKTNQGFLLMTPVYAEGAPPDTPEDRERAAIGLVYAPLLIEEILGDLGLINGEFALALADLDDEGDPRRFYDSHPAQGGIADLTRHRQVLMFGRDWLVEIRALPPFLAHLNQTPPFWVAIEIVTAGLLLAGLLYGYLKVRLRKRDTLQAQARLAAIVEGSHDAIIGLDLEDRVTDWNPAAEAIFGYPADVALGRRVVELIVPPGLEMEQESLLARAVSGDESTRHLTRRHRADSSEFPVAITLSPIRDAQGHIVGVANTLRDISVELEAEKRIRDLNSALERKVAERTAELEKARSLAEQSTEAKSRFLANMSHEIRTPMNAVLGFATALQRLELSPQVAELARKIASAGESLLGIINDILDFSKIDAGYLEIEQAPFHLGEVIDNLATIMAAAAAGKDLELIISPPPREAFHLVGDSLRIFQVLNNLTSNAIKFTRAGLVEVRIDRVDWDHEGVRLRFSVRDTGVGIDAETQSRLFVPFVQEDSSTTRRFGGTGLGLAISRHLVELMGGTLRLESTPGQGSTFTFTLRLPLQQGIQGLIGALPRLKLLIADDNPIVLEGLGATVSSLGWTPELFERGEEILARVLEDPELQGPGTVLLLDWRLPDLDGLAVARRLHQALGESARPIILIVSARAPEQMEDDLTPGLVDVVLSKPIGPSILHTAILDARSARLGAGGPRPTSTPSSQRLRGVRILVVDDSEVNREVAVQLFGYEGAEIHQAKDGREALDWLTAHPGEIDLVLMDVQMPVMDGLEASRRIHRNPALAGLPIAALTAGAMTEQRESALAAGMSGFIPKPFDPDLAVELILGLIGQGAPRAGAPVAERTGEEPSVLDTVGGLSRFRKVDAYHRHLRQFASQYQEVLGPPGEDGEGLESLRDLAHKLRGAAGNLGLLRVAASAAALETRLRTGEDVTIERESLRQDLLEAIAAIAVHLPPEDGPAPAAPSTPPDPETLTPPLAQGTSCPATHS